MQLPKLLAFALIGAALASAETITLTGWFSCETCTAARVAKGILQPANPECADKCINTGSQPVFISEQGKDLLKISNYTKLEPALGFHLEVVGQVDNAGKTIEIQTIRKLEYEGAACSRPRKKSNP